MSRDATEIELKRMKKSKEKSNEKSATKTSLVRKLYGTLKKKSD